MFGLIAPVPPALTLLDHGATIRQGYAAIRSRKQLGRSQTKRRTGRFFGQRGLLHAKTRFAWFRAGILPTEEAVRVKTPDTSIQSIVFKEVVQHRPDEPSYGLLLRNAEHNQWPTLTRAFDLIADTPRQRVSRLDSVKVARACGADPEAVARASPMSAPAIVDIMGQSLKAGQFSVERRRWCPLCLAEDAYHRVWWDVTAVHSCPDHGIELANSCGCIDPALRWRGGHRLGSCRQGHSLNSVPRIPAHPDVESFDTYVVDRLRGRALQVPDTFQAIPLGEFVAICERLGRGSLDETSTTFEMRRSAASDRMHGEGFRILLGLPDTLYEVLARIHEYRADRDGKDGVTKAYGDIYYWIRNLPDHEIAISLKGALSDHARRHIVLKTGTKLDGSNRVVQSGVAASEAAAIFGITYVRFRTLLDRLGIRCSGDGLGRRAEISQADFEELGRRLSGASDLEEACRHLELTGVEVAEIARAGIMECILIGEGETGWLFPADAAANLVAKLDAMAGQLNPRDHALVPLDMAAKHCGISVATILMQILSGRIEAKTYFWYERKLSLFRIDQAALLAAVTPAERELLSVDEAARELGLTLAAMDAVLAAGMLDRSSESGRITAGAIPRFRAAWATMPELRVLLGVSTFPPVAAALTRAGVSPAIVGARLSDRLYPRREAEDACRRLDRPEVAPTRGRDRKAIASELGTTPLMLRQLVDAGLISVQDGCRFDSIADAEIERFRAAYATTSDLALAFATRGWKTILAELAQAGVEPVCRPPEFRAYLFERRAAEDVLRSSRERLDETSTAEQAEPTVDLDEVAQRLGCVRNMALQLAQHGLLSSTKIGRGIMVPVAEIERFRRTYVFGNELGALTGRTEHRGTGKAVTIALLKAGLRPVCARPIFYSYVFERSAARTVMEQLGLVDRAST